MSAPEAQARRPGEPGTRREPGRFWGRLQVGQWIALAALTLALVGSIGIVAGLISLARLGDAREDLFDRVAPANTAAQELESAMLNQETGLRGFLLAQGRESFLEPFYLGRGLETRAVTQLRRSAADPELGAIGTGVPPLERAIRDWREDYAEPTIRRVRRGDVAGAQEDVGVGKGRFDALRAALRRERAAIDVVRLDARTRLNRQADRVRSTVIAFGLGLLLVGLVVAAIVRESLTRPLSQLARQTRRVGSGDFGSPVDVGGARDVVALGQDVDQMREELAGALAAARASNERLDDQARDLARSNAELEQFAYVASHDLQEPLRKVASFTQLLAKRYEGQLDERADQYIGFAVDGAKRMQTLINDLLAFSRVGRVGEEGFKPVDLQEAYARAVANLAARIEETEAQVTADPLPTVNGEAGLLVLLLQNLLGNALKFHGEDPPVVHLGARRLGDEWELEVTDNGIGIDAQYADRIFVIFQRLHAKESYEGTGIGLAMVRKVIEYHGGRVWLDTEHSGGTRFRFTLPVLADA